MNSDQATKPPVTWTTTAVSGQESDGRPFDRVQLELDGVPVGVPMTPAQVIMLSEKLRRAGLDAAKSNSLRVQI